MERNVGQSSDWTTLAGRLDRLERDHRRLQGIAAVSVVIALGAVAAYFLPGPKELVARRLVIVDQHQQPRAELAAPEDGSVHMRLNNLDGKARFMVRWMRDGSASLRFTDPQGVNRAELYTTPDGMPELVMAAADGRTRTWVTVFVPGERFGLVLSDPERVVSWKAP